jgi:hypothetical protein
VLSWPGIIKVFYLPERCGHTGFVSVRVKLSLCDETPLLPTLPEHFFNRFQAMRNEQQYCCKSLMKNNLATTLMKLRFRRIVPQLIWKVLNR